MIISSSCWWSCWKCRMGSNFKEQPMSYCSQQPSKECKCKCDDKKNMDPKCISGKWDDEKRKMIVSNSCKWSCWKCRMEDSFKEQPMSYCSEQPSKDCKCKCDDNLKNMDPKCVSGKWYGEEQKMIISSSCWWSCWKCRIGTNFKEQSMSYCKNN